MAQYNTKNQSSIVSRRFYTDIDINMLNHPQSKDLVLKFDISAIKRSVRNLLSTNNYERPFKPGLGVNLRGMLFELNSTPTDVLKDDVRVFFNHDANLILGRTKSGTAKISTDREGLVYQFEVPDTTYGRDLLVSMERGDVNQSSFAFSVEKDSWSEKNGRDIRTIEKVARLYDVSPVSIPAYPDADSLQVAKRGLEKFKNNEKNKSYSERELLDLKINILKRK